MLLTNLAILVLAGFAGFLTISKVPNTLHTPLMSGTNAIHGIVVLGGILVLGLGVDGFLSKFLLVIAIIFGTINVVGGFLVTDRMLEMFKAKPAPAKEIEEGAGVSRTDVVQLLYIVAFSLFIYGLMGLTGPRTAVRGNRIAAVGMAIAVVATLLIPGMGNWGLIILGVAIGTAVGDPRRAPGEDDRDAADGGAVQRRRRRGGRPDRVGRVPPERRLRGRADLCGDLQPLRGDHRVGLLLGLEHRLRQAAGDPARAPDHRRPGAHAAVHQPGAAGGRRWRARWRSWRGSDAEILMIALLLAAAVLGNFVVLPIGGADMPVVISLLNAFTGLSAAATGVALNNTALIVAGMIVGASARS